MKQEETRPQKHGVLHGLVRLSTKGQKRIKPKNSDFFFIKEEKRRKKAKKRKAIPPKNAIFFKIRGFFLLRKDKKWINCE